METDCRSGRPLVILAGWLGCKPKSLLKYKVLYNKLGWEVVMKIASPQMVIFSSILGPGPMTTKHGLRSVLNATNVDGESSSLGKLKRKRTTNHRDRTMSDLAVEVLQQIHAIQCPIFMVHVFSNGGCFLWESIRHILYTSPTISNKYPPQNNQSATLELNLPIDDLRNKLVGVVFDSSPAAYSENPNLINDAMRFSPLQDRLKLQFYFLIRKMLLSEQIYNTSKYKRASDYWCGMRNCISNVRQLYIFSEDDKLTPFGALRELVHCRQRDIGKDVIFSLQLKNSPHCSHLRFYPKEYSSTVENFVYICSTEPPRNEFISRL